MKKSTMSGNSLRGAKYPCPGYGRGGNLFYDSDTINSSLISAAD